MDCKYFINFSIEPHDKKSWLMYETLARLGSCRCRRRSQLFPGPILGDSGQLGGNVGRRQRLIVA